MERTTSESPFEDLPEALVEEMLSHYKRLGEQVTASLQELQSRRDKIRESLIVANLLRSDSKIILSHVHPTTCGVDGSYAIERLLSTDIAAMAGVAVEGLTPPSEKRHWPQPHHLCDVSTMSHHEATGLIIRALMVTMELELAAKAPHDVVFLDGSLTTPVIHFNQALGRLGEVPGEFSQMLLDRIGQALDNYYEILSAKRSDKIFAGVPKYTSRNEISTSVGLGKHEDRSMLSYVLSGGEMVGPVDMVRPSEDWHFTKLPSGHETKAREIISAIRELNVLYYALNRKEPEPIVDTTRGFAASVWCSQHNGTLSTVPCRQDGQTPRDSDPSDKKGDDPRDGRFKHPGRRKHIPRNARL